MIVGSNPVVEGFLDGVIDEGHPAEFPLDEVHDLVIGVIPGHKLLGGPFGFEDECMDIGPIGVLGIYGVLIGIQFEPGKEVSESKGIFLDKGVDPGLGLLFMGIEFVGIPCSRKFKICFHNI